jgi:hypothetical protein
MKQIFTLLLSLLSLTTFAQNWDEMIKAVASDRGAGDQFGINISISGDRAVVGAYFEDEDISGGNPLVDAGSVYIFELNGGVWSETAKLVASDRGAGDYFGFRVDISGDRVIVGAYLEEEDASGSATLAGAGSAYIFELNGSVWSETVKLVAADRDINDRFGFSVSISGDRAVVGAYQEDEDASGGNPEIFAGSAYIFELSGGIWSETTKLVASDRGTEDRFGRAVSIDGDKVIVGAHYGDEDVSGGAYLLNAGSAYIFEFSGGTWVETAKLVASDRGQGDTFGSSVSISGGKVIIGADLEDEDVSGGASLADAGSAYIFELNGGVWSETVKLVAADRDINDRFGFSVSISGDRAVVGSYQDDEDVLGGDSLYNAGSAYIFEFSGGVWSQTTKLVASDRSGGDNFGIDVSISGDRVIIGARTEDEDVSGGSTLQNAGSAYIFNTCPINPNVTVSGATLTANTTGAAYLWINCDSSNAVVPSETNQSYTAIANGNYAVIVTIGNCTDTSDCAIVNEVGIDDLGLSSSDLKLYPNPTTGNLTIDLGELDNVTISITSSIGKEVFKATDISKNKLEVSLAEFSNGIYFVKIQNGGKIVTRKIIKR